MDGAGNVYVADLGGLIRKITPAGVVSTLAGMGSTEIINYPRAVAVDNAGVVYVADMTGHKIRKITSAGIVSTLAGTGQPGSTDGSGNTASFNNPFGVAVDGAGNVYVGDSGNNKIRKLTPAGIVSTFAGSGPGSVVSGSLENPLDGPANTAALNRPAGVAVDNAGNVYVADTKNNRIRKLSPEGIVSTLAITSAVGVAVDNMGNVYVANGYGRTISKITSGGVSSILAGTGEYGSTDGPGNTATFSATAGVAVDSMGNIYVADSVNVNVYGTNTGTNKIRKITAAGVVTTLADTGLAYKVPGPITTTFNTLESIAVDSAGNVYVSAVNETVLNAYVDPPMCDPNDLPYCERRGYGLIHLPSTSMILKITPSGVVSTFAGAPAAFRHPNGLVVDGVGNVYVADTGNHLIRKITAAGVVSTLAGTGDSSAFLGAALTPDDGPGNNANFCYPTGIALDGGGNIYVGDTGCNRIRKIVIH